MTGIQKFDALLKQHRQAAGLSQEALAEAAGVSARSIGSLERGHGRLPHLETARLLAAALSLDEGDRREFLRAARPANMPEPAPEDPIQPPLFGRATEIEAIVSTIRLAAGGENSRLLTLTGPGGVGKTRLARAAATKSVDTFDSGAVFIDLAPLDQPAFVADTILGRLGYDDRGTESAEDRLLDVLKNKSMLLVLDNVEHLLDARPLVLRILEQCPHVQMLLTSREPTRLRIEREIRVDPLPVPANESTRDELRNQPAVALFLDRANAAGWSSPSDEHLSSIVAICQQLEGLPLAIELVAAWTRVLSPAAILQRLQPALPMLTRGAHDLPARQQTMRDAIGWSYRRLPAGEQVLLRALSVFRGGASLEAFERIVARDVGSPLVLDRLAHLHECSLIRIESGEDPAEDRITLLEIVREFASEETESAGELESARSQQLLMMLDLAETCALSFGGPHEARAFDRIEADEDNLRAALAFALDRPHPGFALRFVVALWPYWSATGKLTEGRRWAEGALEKQTAKAEIDPVICLDATMGAAFLAMEQGDRQRAVELADLARSIEIDPAAHAAVVMFDALEATQRGDYDRATERFRRVVENAEYSERTREQALALGYLGTISMRRGDPDRSAAYFRRQLELLQVLGDRKASASAQKDLAYIHMTAGRLDQAALLARAALAELRQLRDTGMLAEVVWILGLVTMASGNLETAAMHLRESLELRVARGDERNAAKSRSTLAAVAIAIGDLDQAHALLDAAEPPLREQDDRHGLALAGILRGHALVREGKPGATEALIGGAEILQQIDNRVYLPWAIEGLVLAAERDENWLEAARLLGVHEGLRSRQPFSFPPIDARRLDRAMASIQATLDPGDFARQLEIGRSTSGIETVEHARLPDATKEIA